MQSKHRQSAQLENPKETRVINQEIKAPVTVVILQCPEIIMQNSSHSSPGVAADTVLWVSLAKLPGVLCLFVQEMGGSFFTCRKIGDTGISRDIKG